MSFSKKAKNKYEKSNNKQTLEDVERQFNDLHYQESFPVGINSYEQFSNYLDVLEKENRWNL